MEFTFNIKKNKIMGSHYIPVGKIKIDKEILDIVCPAAGYGETPPPPEIYCPANGFIPDPDVVTPWTPPIDTGIPDLQEIILLCTNNSPSVICFRVQGNYTVEVYDSSDVLIETSDHNSGAYYTYEFPTTPENSLYYLKIKNRGGSSLTLFYCADIANRGYRTDWQILEAKFNTPDMVNLTAAFQYIQPIRNIAFYSSLNSLTTLTNFLSFSGIESFTFPESLPAVTVMTSFFEGSKIREIDLNGCDLPSLTNMTSFAKDCSYLFSLIFNPTNVKNLSNLSKAFSYIKRIKEIYLDCTLGEETIIDINVESLFEYSNFEKITCFEGHEDIISNLKGNHMFRNLPNLKEIILRGHNPFENKALISACPELSEVTCGKVLKTDNHTLWTQNPPSRLETINLPETMITGTLNTLASPLYWTYLKELNNKPKNETETSFLLSDGVRYLKTFDQPNLKCTRLFLGAVEGALEYVEVDWDNSSFEFGAAGTIVIILKGNLSATELNRIFNKLPPQTKSIDVRSNPGYATCDHTIATAKGWTVL